MVSAQWHLNPSAQRWSSAYPSAQRWSWASPLWGSHSASFFPSSFTVVPWLLIAPLAWMGPERTAAIWGFWKAPPLAKVVTVSPRMTSVISKFKLLIEVVTTNKYCFSSSVQMGGAIWLVNSTPDAVAEVFWLVASIRLALCPISQTPTWSLVEGTVVHLLSGRDSNDEEVVICVPWAPAESESMLPMSVGVGWGHQLIVPESILPKPWITSCLEKMTCSFPLSQL